MASDFHSLQDDKADAAMPPNPHDPHDEMDHNPIFDALVSHDGEVSGLVAYSLYKQNKRSWIEDFKRIVGRLPNEDETRAYIIGENTERRLATYRLLAQTTLGLQPSPAQPLQKGAGLAWAVWALVALIVLAGLGYVLHAFGVVAK